MAIGPNAIDDCEGMTAEEYYRGMDEAMPEIDREAVAWAYGKCVALGLENGSPESAMMMDRLKMMLGGYGA